MGDLQAVVSVHGVRQFDKTSVLEGIIIPFRCVRLSLVGGLAKWSYSHVVSTQMMKQRQRTINQSISESIRQRKLTNPSTLPLRQCAAHRHRRSPS